MQTIKFTDLRAVVGNSFIALSVRNFPKRNYRYKSIGNVTYLIAKPEVKLSEIEGVKKANPGKQIKICVLPKEVIERVGI